MAVVHSDVARLRQMVGSKPRTYVSGTCDMCLSVVGAMGRSWCNRWGEFQHARPVDVKPDDLNKIIAKFREEKSGWLNKHVFAGFQLNPCQALLLGDANGIDGMS